MRFALFAAIASALAFAASALYRDDSYWGPRWAVDIKVYLAAGRAFLDGQPLYDVVVQSPLYGSMTYTYPPLPAGIFFAPLALLPPTAAGLLWNALSLLALAATIWITTGIAGLRSPTSRTAVTALALVLSFALVPVRVHLVAGQLNMLLLLLVMLDFRPDAGRLRGIGIGIAAGLKVTPLIFILYLAVTNQWRPARTAALAFLGTIAVDLILAPSDTVAYWTDLVLHSSRVGSVFDTPNQSLAGVLSRFGQPTVLLPVVAVTALAGLLIARRARSDFLGFSAAALTGLLVSPVSWEHHWVQVIPLLVWLAIRARGSPALAAVVAVTYAVFSIRFFSIVGIPESPPEPLPLSPPMALLTAVFPLVAVAFLAGLALTSRVPADRIEPPARHRPEDPP